MNLHLELNCVDVIKVGEDNYVEKTQSSDDQHSIDPKYINKGIIGVCLLFIFLILYKLKDYQKIEFQLNNSNNNNNNLKDNFYVLQHPIYIAINNNSDISIEDIQIYQKNTIQNLMEIYILNNPKNNITKTLKDKMNNGELLRYLTYYNVNDDSSLTKIDVNINNISNLLNIITYIRNSKYNKLKELLNEMVSKTKTNTTDEIKEKLENVQEQQQKLEEQNEQMQQQNKQLQQQNKQLEQNIKELDEKIEQEKDPEQIKKLQQQVDKLLQQKEQIQVQLENQNQNKPGITTSQFGALKEEMALMIQDQLKNNNFPNNVNQPQSQLTEDEKLTEQLYNEIVKNKMKNIYIDSSIYQDQVKSITFNNNNKTIKQLDQRIINLSSKNAAIIYLTNADAILYNIYDFLLTQVKENFEPKILMIGAAGIGKSLIQNIFKDIPTFKICVNIEAGSLNIYKYKFLIKALENIKSEIQQIFRDVKSNEILFQIDDIQLNQIINDKYTDQDLYADIRSTTKDKIVLYISGNDSEDPLSGNSCLQKFQLNPAYNGNDNDGALIDRIKPLNDQNRLAIIKPYITEVKILNLTHQNYDYFKSILQKQKYVIKIIKEAYKNVDISIDNNNTLTITPQSQLFLINIVRYWVCVYMYKVQKQNTWDTNNTVNIISDKFNNVFLSKKTGTISINFKKLRDLSKSITDNQSIDLPTFLMLILIVYILSSNGNEGWTKKLEDEYKTNKFRDNMPICIKQTLTNLFDYQYNKSIVHKLGTSSKFIKTMAEFYFDKSKQFNYEGIIKGYKFLTKDDSK